MTLGQAKQLARLAIKRYGVAEERARLALHQAWKATRRGGACDVVEELKRQDLITSEQADELSGYSKTGRWVEPRKLPRDPAQTPLASSTPPSGLFPRVTESKVAGFRLVRKLGEGAMSEVHLARDSEGNTVALKLLNPTAAADPVLLQRFHREAEYGERLTSPHWVRVLGSGHDDAADRHYLMLEYIDGPSSQQLLQRLGKLSVADALRLAADVAMALEHAHGKKIIHRDVKPENVLITQAGVAKLADLGLSKELHAPSNLTKNHHGFGTPYYMPYEQAVSAKSVTESGDLFALGASLYHWLTGQVPFDGENALEILERKNEGTFIPASYLVPEVPEEVDQILARLLARVPEERYQTASDLIVALERTGLVPERLSFVDPKIAAEEPRPTSAQAATQRDVTLANREEPVHVWYLKVAQPVGKPKTLMATTQVLLKALKSGRVPLSATASRKRKGPFLPLEEVGEFTGKLPVPATKQVVASTEPHRDPSQWLWVGAAGLLLLLAAIVYFSQ